jgi:hypothetical protein
MMHKDPIPPTSGDIMEAPYIGITDFTCFDEVAAMLEIFRDAKPANSNRILHVGVMTSYKVLHNIGTSWKDVWPHPEEWRDIFSASEAYNCLHYADFGDTKNDNGLRQYQGLCKVWSLWRDCGANAIQLDMTWPDPEFLEVFSTSDQEVILQVGKEAFDLIDNDPRKLVEKITSYRGRVSRFLLDKSGGKGEGLDAEDLRPFLRAIREVHPHLALSVAGGLGPDSLHLVEPLIDEFPNLSIDAQGRLRASRDAHDPINWGMAGRYIVKALQLLG